MARLLNHGRLAAAVLLGVGSCSVYDETLLTGAAAGSDGSGGSSDSGGTSAAGSKSAAGGSGGAAGSAGAGGSSGGEGPDAGTPPALSALRIEPADATISVGLGRTVTQAFTVYGTPVDSPGEEVDVTERAVLYVPDNFLVGGFGADGHNPFTTRLPASASDPPQRGGVLTVEAQARSAGDVILTATTSLTVKLVDELLPAPGSPEATPAIPGDPEAKFAAPLGTGSPFIVYPTNGVIFPPNLGRLDVHFQRGAAEHTLFQVAFESPLTRLVAYTRCYANPAEFLANSCAFTLEGGALEALATTNGGTGPVRLTVRGTDEAGAVAESQAFDLEFTEQRVRGALYYWTATNPTGIVRLDFGNVQTTPETFLVPADIPGAGSSCVGCHALPPAGDKVFIGLGNSSRGELVYIADLKKPRTDPDFITYNGAQLDLPLPTSQRRNRVLFGAFAPDGSSFVSVAPVNDAEPDTRLFLHDVETGEREATIDVPFVPSHVDWSRGGDKLAVTAIGGVNSTSLEFMGAGISIIERQDGVWQGMSPLTIVPPAAGKNRFNPTFVAEDSLLLFTEVDQAQYSGTQANACNATAPKTDGRFCNGYADPGAATWAVDAREGAMPVRLFRAAIPGPMDAIHPPLQPDVGPAAFMDTFPRAAPFAVEHHGRTLYFVTMSSQRRAGLRVFSPNASVVSDPATQVLLWMFAFDPERIRQGQDGSYPAFFLPYQNLMTSNHMAVWTERIVSSKPTTEPAPTPEAPPRPTPP
jgi:hypothetical protein